MSPTLHPSAQVGADTTFGEGCVVGANARIGTGCRIGHHVVIHADTVIGNDVRIDDHASLGKKPMKAANSATTSDQELPPLTVGDVCIVGTGVVLYRGARIDGKVLMADLSTVRENVTIGRGTIVGRGVTIENFCAIGRYCKLESECYITAYSELEDRVFVAPGVVTSNDNYVGRTAERFKHFKGVTVRKGARIGAGSVILPGIVIGADALVAAGSVVTRDVPERKIVLGAPAKPWRDVPVEQLLENQGWTDT
jgi:UDP-2-acetamido-3-amino-2,3-dideoxy-glucuronate N-acetyltransferase